MKTMVWPVVILLPSAFLVSAILTGVLVRVGHRLDIMDSPGSPGHIKSVRPIPNIGGIAIAWPLIISLFTGVILGTHAGVTSFRWCLRWRRINYVSTRRHHRPRSLWDFFSCMSQVSLMTVGASLLAQACPVGDRRHSGYLVRCQAAAHGR